MKSLFTTAIRVGSMLAVAILMTACGGGDGEAVSAFDRHSVAPQNVITAKAGEYVNVAIESQVFGAGASIEAQTWSYTLQGTASGTLEFSDLDCATARKVSHGVGDATVVNWQCSTTVVAAAGAKGDFLVTAVATDGSGNTERDSVTLRIVP